MAKSNYILIKTEKSFCPDCKSLVHLLCPKNFESRRPQFFICFLCNNIFETGKGKVPSDEEEKSITRSGCI